jgi:hypothetical protein
MIQKLAKVEGHESLIRDLRSHAIVDTNDDGYEAYRRSRENAKKQSILIKKQKEEIDCLKSDIQEIKQMLNLLVRGKE